MADITTGTSVVFDGTVTDGIGGATGSAGQSVYLDTSVSPAKWKLADADAVATAGRDGVGVALNDFVDGGHIRVGHSDGTLTLSGATLTVGDLLVVSTTAGGIAPLADLLSGDFVSLVGVVATATTVKLRCWASGVAKA